MAPPQQHRAEILPRKPAEVAAPAAARFDRLAAIMALADHLHLRGRGEHVERALAHHRVEQLPAFIRRELEQGLVDRDERAVGADGGLAVRGPHLDARFGGFPYSIGLFVGLDIYDEPVPLPRDLDSGDAWGVAWLGVETG